MAFRRLNGTLIALLLLLCDSGSARAYCRTHTDDEPARGCPEPCPEQGFPLAWPDPKFDYVFNVRGFPDISDATLRSIFAESFATWEAVRCSGERVGIESRQLSGTTTAEQGHYRDGPNENVILHFTAEEWDARDFSPQAFAITAVWYNANNGDILGADMMFNGGMDPFGECPEDGCRTSDRLTDLRNVATHEIGHLLGLSHSDVPSSTMWCDASPSETTKRTLAADDIIGLCDVYPPEKALTDAGTSAGGGGDDGSCALSPRGGSAGLGTLMLVALGLLARRRRR